MGLENLSSPFADISKNSMEPQKVSSANSPIKSKEGDESNFTYHSPFYQPDNLFRSQTQNLIAKNSEYDTLEHTFASQGQYNDIIKINKITQDDSPMAPRLVSFINPNGPENSVLENQYVQQSDNSIDIRSSFVNGEDIGKNRQLGVGQFTLENLYRIDHRGAANREPIPLNRTDNDGNPLFVNTLRAGMGSFEGLNIKGHSNSFYGGQPFIVKEIGSVSGNTIQSGNNREILPLRQALNDVSRLAQFYISQAGLLYIGKENLTNILIGNTPSNIPFKKHIDDSTYDFSAFAPKLLDTATLGRIVIPPIPNPIQGNTGFLNFTNQFRDLGPRVASLRFPLRSEYSQRSSLGLPFGFLGDETLEPASGLQIEDIVQPPRRRFRFLGLGQGPKYKSSDLISRVGVIEGDKDENGNPGIPPLEDLSSDAIQDGDFYVRIKDLRDNNFIYFRGFVTGITENVTSNFNPTNYIGRSEPVHVYSHGERDLSFNLRVAPTNKTEFRIMYQKLERLTSLAYPEYKTEVYLAGINEDDVQITTPDITDGGDPVYNEETGEYEFPDAGAEDNINDTDVTSLDTLRYETRGEFRMLAPFCELYMGHVGNKSRGQFGYFKSITYTVNEQGDWDSRNALPRVFDIALNYQMLSRKSPNLSNRDFYGVAIR